jgi:hypothetical protein
MPKITSSTFEMSPRANRPHGDAVRGRVGHRACLTAHQSFSESGPDPSALRPLRCPDCRRRSWHDRCAGTAALDGQVAFNRATADRASRAPRSVQHWMTPPRAGSFRLPAGSVRDLPAAMRATSVVRLGGQAAPDQRAARDIAYSIALRVRVRTRGLSMRVAHASMTWTSNPAGSSSSGIRRVLPRWAALA